MHCLPRVELVVEQDWLLALLNHHLTGDVLLLLLVLVVL
jgi:hypothetical protein